MKTSFLPLIIFFAFAVIFSGPPAYAGETAGKSAAKTAEGPELPDYNTSAWKKVSEALAQPLLPFGLKAVHSGHYLLMKSKNNVEVISVYYAEAGVKIYAEWFRREVTGVGKLQFITRGYTFDGMRWKYDARAISF